jgi:hypothetical protein
VLVGSTVPVPVKSLKIEPEPVVPWPPEPVQAALHDATRIVSRPCGAATDNVADVAFAGNETQLVATGDPDVVLPVHICASTESAVVGIVLMRRLFDDVVAAERVIVMVIVDCGPEAVAPGAGAATFEVTGATCDPEPPEHAALTERARPAHAHRSVFTVRLHRAKRDR